MNILQNIITTHGVIILGLCSLALPSSGEPDTGSAFDVREGINATTAAISGNKDTTEMNPMKQSPSNAEQFIGNERVMLTSAVTGAGIRVSLSGPEMKSFAAGDYVWRAVIDGQKVGALRDVHVTKRGDKTLVIIGKLSVLDVRQELTLLTEGDGYAEVITVSNLSSRAVEISDIRAGFARTFDAASDPWRMVAVPYRRHSYGSVTHPDGIPESDLKLFLHDFSMTDVVNMISDPSVRLNQFPGPPANPPILPLTCHDQRRFRSEGWVFTDAQHGLLVLKYNNRDPEMSAVSLDDGHLVFGGCAYTLHKEPSRSNVLAAGEDYTFGETQYQFFKGGWPEGYALFKQYLQAQGHGIASGYHPKVHWNTLYDCGWKWSREQLLQQIEYASDIGCGALYCDPGWETEISTAIWDEPVLGPLSDIMEILKKKGLALSLWCPSRMQPVPWPDQDAMLVDQGGQITKTLCLSSKAWREERIRRLSTLAQAGVSWMMFDFVSWGAQCYADNHGHRVPSTPKEHYENIFGISHDMRQKFPGLRTEMHGPMWCENSYFPVYFRHGDFDERWAFEFMWNTIAMVTQGRALCLYYYNLACDIPLYLHMNMKADNDKLLAFWWMASTVRHMGIGGGHGSKEAEPSIQGGTGAMLAAYDPEQRYAAYKEAMHTYTRLNPYFTQGAFIGIDGDETLHLHVLSDQPGGVLMVFNLTKEPQTRVVRVPLAKLNLRGPELPRIAGAEARIEGQDLVFELNMEPESPRLIEIEALNAGDNNNEIL